MEAQAPLKLSVQEKKYLLQVARQAIKTALEGKRYTLPSPPTDRLRENWGAFVTLNKNKQLRGCIGLVEGVKPLNEAVEEMARAAAFQDPRFEPLQPEELSDVEIEISVLSPLQRIDSPEKIVVGQHGLLIQKGLQRGLLLPQVATEWGWDRETFLQHTCLKAGLGNDCWKDKDVELYVFTAEVFSEGDVSEA